MTKQAVELHVVSDSTGETATRLVHALEAQFPDQPFEEIRHPQVETVDDLAGAVNRAKGRPAVVVYTLVEPELRDAMRTLCRRARLHYCDLLGQPIEAVAKVSGIAATMRAGSRHLLDETYFRRMEAIEFAVKYDDGISGGLSDADVVVVGLTIDAKRLAEIRRSRARRMGGSNHRYSKLLDIYEELDQAERVQRRLGCPVIDTTELSIEETAARVIRLVEQRRTEAPVS